MPNKKIESGSVTWKFNAASLVTMPLAFMVGKKALKVAGISWSWSRYLKVATLVVLAYDLFKVKVTVTTEKNGSISNIRPL